MQERFKIAVSSYSFQHHRKETGETYVQTATRAKDMGFEGIEFINLSLEGEIASDEIALAKQIREHCKQIDLPIIAYTVRAELMDGPTEIERLKGCVDVAEALGATLMRHDATWQTEGSWQEVIRMIAPAVRTLTEYAAQKGIRTCTENHGRFLQDSNRVEALIQAVNHENYGWLVDIGNFACVDEGSIHAVAIAAPYAFHVHVKDFLVRPNLKNPAPGWFFSRNGTPLLGTIPGHGDIPIEACLKILQEAGYQGYISYEFEGIERTLEALPMGLAHIRSML